MGLTEELKIAVDSWNYDLAPTQDILYEYKRTNDWPLYVNRFKSEVLPKIDWMETLILWEERATVVSKKLDNIVLLCYEKPEDHCHRHILAEHFESEFKCQVKEFGHENMVRDNYKLILENNMDILF